MKAFFPQRSGELAFAAFVSWLLLAPSAWAQQGQPHIAYVYPAGGRQGASFQLTIGGQFLEGVTNAYCSGTGVQAKVIGYHRPLTQREFNQLREKVQQLAERKAAAGERRGGRGGSSAATSKNPQWTPTDQKLLEELRLKLFRDRPARDANPALVEKVTLQVTIGTNAEPNSRELRLGTPTGLSNPLAFSVGQIPEFTEKELKEAGKRVLELPAVINGQIMPGEVDRFRFHARRGDQIVATVSARELIPYLPDAVPGWFQATLGLYGPDGAQLLYQDDYRFHLDPVLHLRAPEEGDYTLEIKDSIYRGREDFVYRITLGQMPFITSIFPLGCQTGAVAKVEIDGWNLPLTELTEEVKNKPAGVYPLSAQAIGRVSNRVPFAVDALPDCLEQEPNNEVAKAHALTLPLIVNGRIDQPGDCDLFCFQGKAGEQIVAEVYARRLDSPLDSLLKLTDENGVKLAQNDDHEDKGTGLNTHHADSYLRHTLPKNGRYYLHLSDAQRNGGREFSYRLRVSPPQPDFQLRIVPSSIVGRPGFCTPVTVYALRSDGFSNAISLSLKYAPRGFWINGGTIPAGQDQVRFTLSVPAFELKEPVNLWVEGRAAVGGREVVRPGVPCEDMMQAFAYRHLVPTKELKVAVIGRFFGKNNLRVLNEGPVKIVAGGTASIRIGAYGSAFLDRIHFQLDDPPEGLAIEKISPSSRGAEIVLKSDAAKLKPGLKGNLIVSLMYGKALNTKAKNAPNIRRSAPATLPAIPFEVIKAR